MILGLNHVSGWRNRVCKNKKPLKIKRLTTVIVLKAGREPVYFLILLNPFKTA
jgi:hypothetical protein